MAILITNTVTLSGEKLTVGELRDFLDSLDGAPGTTEVKVQAYNDQRDGQSVRLSVEIPLVGKSKVG